MHTYFHKFFKLSKFIVFIVDLLLIHAGFILAYIIKFGMNPPIVNFKPYYELIPVITLSAIILFHVYGLYTISRRTYGDIVFSLILSLLLLQVITGASTFFIRQFAFPRSIFFYSFWSSACIVVSLEIFSTKCKKICTWREESNDYR